MRARDWLRARGIALCVHDRAGQACDLSGVHAGDDPPRARRCRGPIRSTRRSPAPASTRSTCARRCSRRRRASASSSHRYALERPRRAASPISSIIEAVRAQVPADAAGVDARRFRRRSSETIAGRDLAGMLGLKRVLRETDLRLVPRRPRRARVVEPPGADADGRSRPARHRDPGLDAAPRGDLPRLVRVAARAVPLRALQPRGLSLAERLRRRRRQGANIRTS